PPFKALGCRLIDKKDTIELCKGVEVRDKQLCRLRQDFCFYKQLIEEIKWQLECPVCYDIMEKPQTHVLPLTRASFGILAETFTLAKLSDIVRAFNLRYRDNIEQNVMEIEQ
ncbi:9233_t:CDS:2, partial [Acaulospora colombiana]